MPFSPGMEAPNFTVTDLSGKSVKLSDYRGKVVLLNLWASWCGECVHEVPELNKLHSMLSSNGLVVFAVAVGDTLDSAKSFASNHGIAYPVMFDATSEAPTKYKTTGIPEAFIIDKEGRFVLFEDVGTGNSSVRIIGARKWSDSEIVSQLKKLL